MKSLALVQSSVVRQLVLALTFAAVASTAQAQIDVSETTSLFGDYSQYNSGITVTNNLNIQPQACVPTSVLNGLTFLNNVNNGTVFQTDPEASYANLNSLATSMKTANNPILPDFGTSYGNGITGLQAFTSPTGTDPAKLTLSLSGQYLPTAWNAGLPANGANLSFSNAIPTASFLGNALQANDAVQLCILWGTYNPTTDTFTPPVGGGSHEIDLTSLDLNASGNGTAGIIVPESAAGSLNDANATAQILENCSFQTLTTPGGAKLLSLTYGTTQAISGTPGETGEVPDSNPLTNPPDQTAGVGAGVVQPTGIIIADYVEAVPEPSTYAMFGVGFAALLVMAARRKAKAW